MTRSIGWLPSTAARTPRGPVVPDDLVQGAELLAQASLHRGRLVVGALVQLGPVDVADTRHERRLGLLVVRMALRAADPAAAEAGHQIGLRDLDVRRDVHPAAAVGEGLVEDLGLSGVAREAVEQDALRGVRLGQPLEEHVDRHRIGDEFAAVHVALGGEAQRRPVADGGPEQVAGGDVGQAEPLGQDLGLRPLAGAGGAEKDDARCPITG